MVVSGPIKSSGTLPGFTPVAAIQSFALPAVDNEYRYTIAYSEKEDVHVVVISSLCDGAIVQSWLYELSRVVWECFLKVSNILTHQHPLPFKLEYR